MQPLLVEFHFGKLGEPVRRNPYWLTQHVSLDEASTYEKRCHCLVAWKRFVELADWLELDLKTRLRILGGVGRRSYFRWCEKARNGVPFQIPSRNYLLGQVLDVLEAVRDHMPAAEDAQRFLRAPLGKPPFMKHAPLNLLMLGKPLTTWPLYVRVVSKLAEMAAPDSRS